MIQVLIIFNENLTMGWGCRVSSSVQILFALNLFLLKVMNHGG